MKKLIGVRVVAPDARLKIIILKIFFKIIIFKKECVLFIDTKRLL